MVAVVATVGVSAAGVVAEVVLFKYLVHVVGGMVGVVVIRLCAV